MESRKGLRLNADSIPDNDPLGRIVQCEFDLSGARLIRSRRFGSPSPLARRSYFYLQNMATINFPGNYFTRRSGLKSYLMALTFSGEGQLEYEGKKYMLRPNEGFIIDCRVPHYCRAASRLGWAYHIVHFEGFAMTDYFTQIRRGRGIQFSFSHDNPMYSLLDELYDANREFNNRSEFLTSCILTNMITEIMKAMSIFDTVEAPEKIKNIRDYIEEHYAESISLEGLSDIFALSMYHLSREFKKYIGQSPGVYLRMIRIANAKALLHSTDMKIDGIAREVGFADNTHFFEVFKKYEHISPAAYRRQWGY
jgi:AraC-like DNA-binding protein